MVSLHDEFTATMPRLVLEDMFICHLHPSLTLFHDMGDEETQTNKVIRV